MKLFGIDTTQSYTEQELKNLEIEAELRFNHFVSKALFITAVLVVGMVIWHLGYQLVAAVLN